MTRSSTVFVGQQNVNSTTQQMNKNSEITDFVCPFCGLLCDDLSIDYHPNGQSIASPECSLAHRRIESVIQPETHDSLVNGAKCSRKQAIARAAELLSTANFSVLYTVATDVEGSRASIELAERTGSIIDQSGNPAFHRVASRIQARGTYFTTISEVKNRADLIVLFGNSLFKSFPRLLDVLAPNESFFSSESKDRKIVLIGSQQINKKFNSINFIDCDIDKITHLIAIVQANLNGIDPPSNDYFNQEQLTKICQLATEIQNSNYSVLLWCADEFNSLVGDLTIDAIMQLVDSINEKKRSTVLPLTRNPSLTTFNQVCTWQTGNLSPISFLDGTPEFHPQHYSLESMLNRQQIDLLVWIGGLEESVQLPPQKIPTVVLSPNHVSSSDVYIPVGIPGIDHNGHLFRTDSVVPLYLHTARTSKYPSAASTIRSILKALEGV